MTHNKFNLIKYSINTSIAIPYPPYFPSIRQGRAYAFPTNNEDQCQTIINNQGDPFVFLSIVC